MNLLLQRKKKDITQEELAKEIGVSRSLISQIENNISSPSISTAIALAKALGCTLDELLAESEEEIQEAKS